MRNEDIVNDRLLGMLAVEERFITEKQLTECLNHIELYEPEKTLKQVLLQKEYLTKAQIQRLESKLLPRIVPKIQAKKAKMFGEVALEQNMIDQSQLERALQEQQKYAERGVRLCLGQIMHKIGFLTLPQVKKILESQLKKILYCDLCGTTKAVFNYNPSVIYQCEKCGVDMREGEKKKQAVTKAKASKPKEDDFLAEDEEEEEGGLGKLNILEL